MERAERDLDAARETEATLRQAEAQLRAELERARKSKSWPLHAPEPLTTRPGARSWSVTVP
jgi:hypothetical protein